LQTEDGMPRSLRRSGFVRGALAAAALPAIGATTIRAARAQAPVKLRVAGIPIDVAAVAYYALDQGYFARHGLDVEIVQATSGAVVAPAVLSGSLDIGNGNTTVLATGHERGLPFVLIAPSGAYLASAPTSAIVVASASPIKTVRDLAGKTISMGSIRTINEVSVRALFDKEHVDSSTVKFIELSGSAIGAALSAGRTDAALTEEPWLNAVIAGGARKIATPFDQIASRWIEGGYFCTLDFARDHLDVVKRFALAISETSAWANKNPDATAKILEKYAKTAVPATMVRTYYPEHLVASDLQPLIDASAKYGLLKASFPAKDLFAPGL
jgi:NitT/TauT family transport system substrate-binding protein